MRNRKSTRQETIADVRNALIALLIVFLVLKLNHLIDWSWWWVLSPLWIPLFIGLVYLGALYLYIYAVKKGRKL